ncbi:MAG: type II toxin-antitoxin system VapC family toxin [Planctomycetota bacterium]
MMGYLLDTNAVLWCMDRPERLRGEVRELIEDRRNPIYISAAGTWEMSVKHALGRLELPLDIRPVLEQMGIRTLPVTVDHAHVVRSLPPIHRDPFDRIMIAQSKHDDLAMITSDVTIAQYDIKTIMT